MNNPKLLSGEHSSIRYQVGNAHFEGQTVVEIRGDGSAIAEFVRGRQKLSFSGRLDRARFDQVRSTLVANDPRKITPSQHRPVPDEARIELSESVGGENWNQLFWDADRQEQPALRKIVELFESVAREISDGKIQF
jgi:hypothetical protein